MKNCNNPSCTEENPQALNNFYKITAQKSGLRARCKTCIDHDNRERKKQPKHKKRSAEYTAHYRKKFNIKSIYNPEWAKQHYKKTAEIVRRKALLREYGLTQEQELELKTKQNNCCAICGNPETLVEKRSGKLKI